MLWWRHSLDGVDGSTAGPVGTSFVEALDPIEVFVGLLLIATGFVAGIYATVYLRGLLGRHLTEQRLSLSDAFIADFAAEEWDPSEIRPEPNASELASQEEHVIRLLIANEGRMRQSTLIAETGWSQAKVSRLLQEMEANGDVSRIHVGRHNLVVLGRFPPLADGRAST